MDDAESYKQEQDFMFAELETQRKAHEQAYLDELLRRAKAAGLLDPATKLLLALELLTPEDVERKIASANPGLARNDE